MHSYVDRMNFTNLSFDNAIRIFVSGFLLPGEAQKIDRLMEKFAEHYHRQNPGPCLLVMYYIHSYHIYYPL